MAIPRQGSRGVSSFENSSDSEDSVSGSGSRRQPSCELESLDWTLTTNEAKRGRAADAECINALALKFTFGGQTRTTRREMTTRYILYKWKLALIRKRKLS